MPSVFILGYICQFIKKLFVWGHFLQREKCYTNCRYPLAATKVCHCQDFPAFQKWSHRSIKRWTSQGRWTLSGRLEPSSKLSGCHKLQWRLESILKDKMPRPGVLEGSTASSNQTSFSITGCQNGLFPATASTLNSSSEHISLAVSVIFLFYKLGPSVGPF